MMGKICNNGENCVPEKVKISQDDSKIVVVTSKVYL